MCSYIIVVYEGLSAFETECGCNIEPGASGMGLESTVMAGAVKPNNRLVKGCPCMKEFGREKVCLNNDDVIPIRTITVDPIFFGNVNSFEDLAELKSSKKGMCYLLVFLDNDSEQTFCVSQGQLVRINGRKVKASEISAALQFVTTTEESSDGVICSSCLYKYLLTLGDTFSDVLTESEKDELIASYVKGVTTQMAVDLIGNTEEADSEELDDLINKRIKTLLQLRSSWTSVIHDLRSSDSDRELVSLIGLYRLLSRLEGIFLFQVSTLRDSHDSHASLGLLRFMVDVAERVIRVIDEIREKTFSLGSDGRIPNNIETLLEEHQERRSETEIWFRNLIGMLNQIETRTSQKSL